MADNMNNARAVRLAEIISDFRNLQHYIAQIRTFPSAEEYNGYGYALLRQCATDGRAVLAAPFNNTGAAGNDPEQQKRHLQYVILDASARRFQAHRIYLKATAAMRWINNRNSVLQGQRVKTEHAHALRRVDQTLQTELGSITDERIVTDLRNADSRAGKWVNEDPPLATLSTWIARRQ